MFAFTKDQTKKQDFERLFGGSGTVRWIDDEDQIHVTTAISGSGPAYFFAFVEALAVSGANVGLSAQLVIVIGGAILGHGSGVVVLSRAA